jgi:hypothetical protein
MSCRADHVSTLWRRCAQATCAWRGARSALMAGGCLAAALSMLAVGCGSSASSTAASTVRHISLAVISPATPYVTSAQRVTVRGLVSPAQASVQIAGVPAVVAAGLFSASIGVHGAHNELQVVASAPGAVPVHETLIVLRPSARSRAHPLQYEIASARPASAAGAARTGGARSDTRSAVPSVGPRSQSRHTHSHSPATPAVESQQTVEGTARAPSSSSNPTPATGVTIPHAEAPPAAAQPEAAAEPTVSIPQSQPSP